ncbi:MAG: DUF1631 family protein [Comamonas sp.]
MVAAPVPAQRQPQARRRLARQARLRFVGGLCAGVPGLVQALLQDLARGLSHPGEDDKRTHVALRSAHDELTALHEAWTAGVVKSLRQSFLADEQADPAPRPFTESTLELMSDAAMDGRIAASHLAQQLLEHLAPAFDVVRRTTQFLEDEELPAADILRPESVCVRVVDAWHQAGLGQEAWTVALPELRMQLRRWLQPPYEAVRQFYADSQAASAEDLRAYRIKRAEGAEAAAPAPAPGAPSGFAAAAPGTWPAGMAVPSGYGAPMVVAGQSLPAGYRAPGAGPQPFAAQPFAQARQRASQVMAQLRQFLGGGGPSVSMAEGAVAVPVGWVPTPALQQALAAGQTVLQSTWFQTAQGVAGVGMVPAAQLIGPVALAVRQQSTALKQVATSEEEKAIIEIVALMFQSILHEERIPQSVRIWFARLQVPVLRVALAEPEFFNDLEHPARQLIDRMGACVLGFEAAELGGAAVEAEIRRIVQVIEQYPETGSRVFQLVLKEFQQFLEKSLQQSPQTRTLVSLAERVEHRETLAIQYTIQLRDMLAGMPIRDEIRDFLFRRWSEVLAVSAVRFGAQHETTLRYKQAAADLVWSASAKSSKEERAQVMRQLPQLLGLLRQGLALAGVVDEAQEAVVKALTDTLADAFLAKTAEISRQHIDAIAQRLEHLEDALDDVVTDDYPLSADSIELLLGIDANTIHVIADNASEAPAEALEWARALLLGHWFLLDHNGSPIQAQYVWQSKRQQLHLFAAPNGFCFLFQLQRLAGYLQAGLLAPRELEGITARASRDALAKIEANPERLLQ